MLNNPLARKKRQFFHHTSGWRKRKIAPEAQTGWVVRFRNKKTGLFERFKPGVVQRADFFIWKKTVEDTDAPKGKAAAEAKGDWVPARPYILKQARQMAADFMVKSEVPYDPWELKEKGPIAYKWLHREYAYLNDFQTLDEGNYVPFYILIAVFGEKLATFMIIRKTVLLQGDWTVARMQAERSIFDDLGKDYVQRQGHLWTSEAMSPQITNVEYVGFLAYTLFPFVPLDRNRKKHKRIRKVHYDPRRYRLVEREKGRRK